MKINESEEYIMTAQTLLAIQTEAAATALSAQNKVSDNMIEAGKKVANLRILLQDDLGDAYNQGESFTARLDRSQPNELRQAESRLHSATLTANPHLATLGHDETLGQGEKFIRQSHLKTLQEDAVKQAAEKYDLTYFPPCQQCRK